MVTVLVKIYLTNSQFKNKVKIQANMYKESASRKFGNTVNSRYNEVDVRVDQAFVIEKFVNTIADYSV